MSKYNDATAAYNSIYAQLPSGSGRNQVNYLLDEIRNILQVVGEANQEIAQLKTNPSTPAPLPALNAPDHPRQLLSDDIAFLVHACEDINQFIPVPNVPVQQDVVDSLADGILNIGTLARSLDIRAVRAIDSTIQTYAQEILSLETRCETAVSEAVNQTVQTGIQKTIAKTAQDQANSLKVQNSLLKTHLLAVSHITSGLSEYDCAQCVQIMQRSFADWNILLDRNAQLELLLQDCVEGKDVPAHGNGQSWSPVSVQGIPEAVLQEIVNHIRQDGPDAEILIQRIEQLEQALQAAGVQVPGSSSPVSPRKRARSGDGDSGEDDDCPTQLARAQQEIKRLKKQISDAKAANEAHIARMQGEVRRLNLQLPDAQADNDSNATDPYAHIASLRTRITALGQQVASLELERDSLAQQLQDADYVALDQDAIDNLYADIFRLHNQLAQERQKLKNLALKDQSEIVKTVQAALDAANAKNGELQQELDQKTDQLETPPNDYVDPTEAQMEIARLQNEVEQLKSNLEQAQIPENEQIQTLTEELARVQQELDEKTDELQNPTDNCADPTEAQMEIARLQNEVEQLQSNLEQAQIPEYEIVKALKEEVARLMAENDLLEIQLDDLGYTVPAQYDADALITELQQEVSDLQQMLEECNNDRANNEELLHQISDLKQLLDECNGARAANPDADTNTAFIIEFARVRATITDLQSRNRALLGQLQAANTANAELQQKLDQENSIHRNHALWNDLQAANANNAALQTQLAQAHASNQTFQHQPQVESTDDAEMQQKLNQVYDRNQTLWDNLQAANDTIATLQRQLDEANAITQSLRDQLQGENDTIARLQLELDAANARVASPRDNGRLAQKLARASDTVNDFYQRNEILRGELAAANATIARLQRELDECNARNHDQGGDANLDDANQDGSSGPRRLSGIVVIAVDGRRGSGADNGTNAGNGADGNGNDNGDGQSQDDHINDLEQALKDCTGNRGAGEFLINSLRQGLEIARIDGRSVEEFLARVNGTANELRQQVDEEHDETWRTRRSRQMRELAARRGQATPAGITKRQNRRVDPAIRQRREWRENGWGTERFPLPTPTSSQASPTSSKGSPTDPKSSSRGTV